MTVSTSLKPFILSSASTDPYSNLALEEALVCAVRPGQLVLYLWQNANTIVIGRNQNPWKECRVADFEADGGRIARRLSGGGAVFHDVGNLNFTFAAHESSYDVSRHLRIVCDAVRSFGIDAVVSGRNDVTANGAKFSGNAFFQLGEGRCHHGTLMVGVDTARLSQYLVPDSRKLAARGIASVASRVVNLATLCPDLTVEALAQALGDSLASVCGEAVQPFDRTQLDQADLASGRERFASDAWRLGKTAPFTYEVSDRFAWGGLDLELLVEKGTLMQVRIFSDALDADFIDRMRAALTGCDYRASAIQSALQALELHSDLQRTMRDDCNALLLSSL